jgi:DNA-binding CsgD family transcriptional regulator
METPSKRDLTALERLRYELSAATRLRHVKAAVQAYSPKAGIKMVTYYHYPPVGAVDFGPDIAVYTFGFPAAWVEAFVREGFMEIDPISKLAAKRTLPFPWSEAETERRLDANERRFFQVVKETNVGEGLAVPVFGPNGRRGFYATGFGPGAPLPDDQRVAEIHAACQFAHLRFCELMAQRLPDSVTLSDREREILSYLARGQSNQMIATKLNISANTVDTYVRRCFEKLDVHDRVSAGLRGLALGLVA